MGSELKKENVELVIEDEMEWRTWDARPNHFVTLNTTLHALILHLEDYGNITIWKVWHKSLFF